MKQLLIILGFIGLVLSQNSFADYPQVPHFKLNTDSGHITSTQFKGDVVYIDFWASWCKPCQKSFPWMNELQSKYGKQGFKIIAINLDKESELAKQFLAQVPSNFTVAYDPEGQSAESFQVQGMPSSYLVDRQGRLRNRHIGFRENDKAELEQTVLKLLQE